MKKMLKIDFVLPWVNGNDPDWRARFEKYSDISGDSREIRFRDWGLLKYWFRGVEKFAPWYNAIFFITSGELPDWLNINHPKLKWVKHEDFIPADYLPTFSVRPIELNLHRIQDLSDTFIYFNDDSFLLKSVCESRFFKNGLPYDFGVMTAKPASGGTIHTAISDLEVIEKHFDKHSMLKNNPSKWFSPNYGIKVLNNILLFPWKEFSGFIDPHLPNAFLKSTFVKVWGTEPSILDQTCRSKFRTEKDVNQWLIRYWRLAEGEFYPKNIRENTLCTDINRETYQNLCDSIKNQSYDIMVLNDSEDIEDFEAYRNKLEEAFESILPEKSSFEK